MKRLIKAGCGQQQLHGQGVVAAAGFTDELGCWCVIDSHLHSYMHHVRSQIRLIRRCTNDSCHSVRLEVTPQPDQQPALVCRIA